MATTTSTMSGTQFDALPYDEGRRWELLEGELIEVSSPTPRHQDIVFVIQSVLRRYLSATGNLGRTYADVEFALSTKDRLRPDICFIVEQKAVLLDPDRIPIPGAPDLAIEVISPSERSVTSHSKVLTYLRNGTSEVWQVYPNSRTVEVHRVGASALLESGQPITSELLPGFTALVSTFFA